MNMTCCEAFIGKWQDRHTLTLPTIDCAVTAAVALFGFGHNDKQTLLDWFRDLMS